MDDDQRRQALRRAQNDQCAAALHELATHLTTYYQELINGGLTPEQAMGVVLQWHALFWTHQFARQGAA